MFFITLVIVALVLLLVLWLLGSIWILFNADPSLDDTIEQTFRYNSQQFLTNLKGEELEIVWSSFTMYRDGYGE